MATQNQALTLKDALLLGPEDFAEHDGCPPLHPHALWRVFASYTETFLTGSILIDGKPSGLKPIEPAGGIIAGVTPLEGLAACAVLADQLQRSRWWITAEARKRGASWAEIGAALGMTKQAAWEAFRKHADSELFVEYRLLAGESAEP